ncbi:cytochrome P450 [Halocatena salina]|uniref:Cytochrome P450 n=1 Tax=Halocatena salina TaxID=2934340 RepID=A0A8U0A7F4_9EURY|nr:cytochrome P450 [Halocatena salina]UPM44934.1 cytochrome P450 [Halocatena salina]
MDGSESFTVDHMPDPIASPEGQLDPYPWYQKMRDTAPVRYDETRECWDMFQYDDIQTVLTDFDTFSSEHDISLGNESEDSALDLGETMINRDPPEHERLRGIVDEYFQPGYLRQFEENFEELAHTQLDQILADGTEFDFASEFAAPIPAIVIGEILGIPREKREILTGVRQDGDNTQRELKEYITGLVQERKETPTDDILSEVIHATPDGKEMTAEEIYNFCALLLLAGSHTTVTLLTNAIWMFTEHDFISDVRVGAIDLDTAIEEVLRYQPSVHTVVRTATEDVALHGNTIQEGDRIVAWVGSANRDPRQFDDPETFDPERKPNPHMTFGRGIHVCLGAPLARLEARTVLRVFFDRISDVDVTTDERTPITTPTLWGLQTLPISVRT